MIRIVDIFLALAYSIALYDVETKSTSRVDDSFLVTMPVSLYISFRNINSKNLLIKLIVDGFSITHSIFIAALLVSNKY